MDSVKMTEISTDDEDEENTVIGSIHYIEKFLKLFYSNTDSSLTDSDLDLKSVSKRFYETRRLRDYIHVARGFIDHFRSTLRLTHGYYAENVKEFDTTRVTNRLHGHLNDLEDKFRIWSDNYRHQIDKLKTMDPHMWNYDSSYNSNAYLTDMY